MNINKDPELKTFFQELRKQDEQLIIPPFPEVEKKSRSIWWIPAGIAATLLLGAFFLPLEKSAEPTAPEVLIITLEEGPNQELQFHIQETNEMDIWESPTASLLTEY
ncbi:hypothetical protein [Algoriphagus taiwanensis]